MISKKIPLVSRTLRTVVSMFVPAAILLATSCSREPSFNILGSYFPAWIFCGLIGILLTVIARLIFVRLNFEQELSPLLLVYPCLAACFTFTSWLLFFS
jgi:YtcA family